MSCGQELLEGGKKEAVVEVEGNEIAVQVWGSQCRLAHAFQLRDELGWTNTNEGELIAFIAYAQAFPTSFLVLVDTYDTVKSGTRNFLLVALGLLRAGYKPIGIRLDSGDLAYLSKVSRQPPPSAVSEDLASS